MLTFLTSLSIYLQFICPSLTEAPRERLAGEIVPVSAEHSRTFEDDETSYGAANTIDLNFITHSYTQPGSDNTSWLKVTLDQVYCLKQAVSLYRSGAPDLTWTCSDTDCTCSSQHFCSYYTLTVYTEEDSSDNLPSMSDCKYGNRVRLQRKPASNFGVYEIAIIGTLEVAPPKCEDLDPTWKNVVTEPVLPVEDGVEVTLTCAGGWSNKGGKNATCQSGDLVPTKGAPYCFVAPPKCEDLDPTWKNVVTEPVLPVEDGEEVKLTCAGGRSNKGGKNATCQSGDLVPKKGAPYCFGNKIIRPVAWGLSSIFLVTMAIMTIFAARKFLLRKCPCGDAEEAEYSNAETFELQCHPTPLPALPLPLTAATIIEEQN